MFESGKVYTNRYNDEYTFVPLTPNTYQFRMTGEGDSLAYCRCGGKIGQDALDTNDLGMFDPSGGPYVSIGTRVDNKPITRIYQKDNTFYVET